MSATAASPSPSSAKGRQKKPKPLLPPEEEVVAPPPKLSWQERVLKAFGDTFRKVPVKSPFATPAITVDVVNDQQELGRARRAARRMTHMSIGIAALSCLLAFAVPFIAPIYIYHSVTPEGRSAVLVPLDMPNLTNPAIVSWAATSVTEIMSFGFGDVEAKTYIQKRRFTPGGWKVFIKAFLSARVIEAFKKNQMVMTTVPSDTPIITAQGVNSEDRYEWKVEVPIISTYAANNNVIKPEHATIRMTVVRVPYDQSTSGVAIDIWRQIKH